MNSNSSSSRFPETGLFHSKAEAAWDVLNRRYSGRISDAEIDHMFARFVFGLTSPRFGEGEPSAHFDICRALVALRLPAERAYAALHSVPGAHRAMKRQ